MRKIPLEALEAIYTNIDILLQHFETVVIRYDTLPPDITTALCRELIEVYFDKELKNLKTEANYPRTDSKALNQLAVDTFDAYLTRTCQKNPIDSDKIYKESPK